MSFTWLPSIAMSWEEMDGFLQDDKSGKNRVVAKVIPEHMSGWDFRQLSGAGGSSTA
jgi:hypothetical protein